MACHLVGAKSLSQPSLVQMMACHLVGAKPLSRRCQAIIWNSAWILLIRPLGTKFNEILIKIHAFSFKKMHLKLLSVKWWPFCLSRYVLRLQCSLSCIFNSFSKFICKFFKQWFIWGWCQCDVNCVTFKRYLQQLMYNCPQGNGTQLHSRSVNIGSGNGLVPLGSKPLPESMMAIFSDSLWHLQELMG